MKSAATKLYDPCETCPHPFTCETGAFQCSDAVPIESAATAPPRQQLCTMDHCRPPKKTKSRRNTLWICECGQGWTLHQDGINYAAGPIWRWFRWPARV